MLNFAYANHLPKAPQRSPDRYALILNDQQQQGLAPEECTAHQGGNFLRREGAKRPVSVLGFPGKLAKERNPAASDDVIDLTGVTGLTGFTDVQTAASQVGADTLIDFSGGNQITLVGVDVTTLNPDDFLI